MGYMTSFPGPTSVVMLCAVQAESIAIQVDEVAAEAALAGVIYGEAA